jgi:[protein-PII] uridylyltransferase
MLTIDRPRAVIDRRALTAALDDLAAWSGYSPKTHGRVLELFKAALAGGAAEIRHRFESEAADGIAAGRAQAYLIDQIVRALYDFAAMHAYPSANPTRGEQIAVLATGGYGRGVMAPYSDVDLMFLHPHKLTPRTEQIVEFILYALWDLGLKVGHATRSVDEALKRAAGDVTIRTSLLEARWIWGDADLAAAFRTQFMDGVVAKTGPAFVEQKLAERDARHDRVGDARYVLEPNVKEGKGGLRDLQTLFWIAKYLYRVDSVADLVGLGVLTRQDARTFEKAETFLWTVRWHLHLLAGRAEERLTFDVQTDIGARMGYADRAGVRGVERFMKHYFLIAKDVGDLTRVLCAVLEDQHKKKSRFALPGFGRRKKIGVPGFTVDGGRLTVDRPEVLTETPVNMIRLFRLSQAQGLDIHPEAVRLVKQSLKAIDKTVRADPEANALFMDILTARERIRTRP